MHQTGTVSGVNGLGERLNQGRCLVWRSRFVADVIDEADAADILSRGKGPALVFVDLVNLNDIGMIQARDGLGFGTKTLDLAVAGMRPGKDHLESDEAFETFLTGLVDNPHAAPAEFFEEFVTGNVNGPQGRRGNGTRGRANRV